MSDYISKHGFVTSPVRSNTMRKIKSKNTKPELILRQYLWEKGIRYRLKNADIIGKPDITIRRKKLAIFVDGEFWHGHNWEEKKEKIKSNREYWIPKIERNIERDKKTNQLLIQSGWKVIRFWENEVFSDIDTCLNRIISNIR